MSTLNKYAAGRLFRHSSAAREMLRERSSEIIMLFINNAKMAQAAGDYETAHNSLKWLLEHMPKDDDGTTIIDASVDKVIQAAPQDMTPRIQIGIQVGGLKNAKELPPAAEVIDADKP